jgi:DNA (cytosine-5)-methyltransferase 1
MLSSVPIDLVAGGPPCQPFSRAGRSKIRSLVEEGRRSSIDLRSYLWRAFVEVVLALRPRVVLMENVPDMAFGDDFQTVRHIAIQLEDAGYETEINLVDAWKFGVPQHRKRLILLARRDGGIFTWPPPDPNRTLLGDAIRDLPRLDAADGDIGSRSLPYRGHDQSEFALRMRKGMSEPVIWDHMTRPVRQDDREIFDYMTPEMLYTAVPERLRRYSADTFDDKYNKLSWDELCRTITAHIAKDGYWYIHPDQPRTLSVREAARVQTFPDRFRFAGTRSDAFRQIGNAVPPMLGFAAASALRPIEEQGRSAHVSRWISTRTSLRDWATEQRRGKGWYLFPGPDMTKPVALLVSLLETRSSAIPGVADAVEHIRDLGRITGPTLKELEQLLSTPAGKRAIDQLRPLTRKRRIWENEEELSEAAGLKPAQLQLFRVLCGHDALLVSQAVLRVAARVAGSESHRSNRLTDGKVAIARLMGSHPDSALRVAALRLIGSTICQEKRQICETCPLLSHCATGLGETASDQLTLFKSMQQSQPAV